MKNTFIKKPWGSEELIFNNRNYTLKKLVMNKGHRCSLQYHKKKHESFFVLYGKIKAQINSKVFILRPGQLINIPSGAKHFFKDISKNGSVIEELSTTSTKNDSFYIDKKINKNIKRKSFVSINL